GMKLKRLTAGSFRMGSPPDEPGRDEEEAPHTVTISRPFAIGVFEVTQEEYATVTGKNPSGFSAGGKEKALVRGVDTGKFPVERVSWEGAVEFCKKLSELPGEKQLGRRYRLPTEAEWEYACRAGTETAYSFRAGAEGLGEHGWFDGNSDGR